MNTITSDKVVEIITNEFKELGTSITIESSMDNTMDWDSLIHLGILVALDTELDGQVSKIKKLAGCQSVRAIIECLRENGLINGI